MLMELYDDIFSLIVKDTNKKLISKAFSRKQFKM